MKGYVNDELERNVRKRSWPNMRYYSGTWLDGLRKNVRIAGLRANIAIHDLT
jgi:hypothetical protein